MADRARRLAGASPTLQLGAVFLLFFALQSLVGPRPLALAWPPRPWTPVTSVYTHGSASHLLGNLLALALVGFPLERLTTRLRFHGFVLATGATAGLVEVLVGAALGRPTAVLGASGAVLALYGYVLAGNRLTGTLVGRFDPGPRARLVVYGAVAAAVALLTAGPGVAVVAHVAGFLLGALAGRAGLLS
ncbi:MAG: rhomboid family intramembrane serine protease [Halobacteriaceae archaeon]